jgi:threonine aldolase
MVFIDVPQERLAALKQAMETASIRLSIGYAPRIRLVTHLDLDDEGIRRTIDALRQFAA